MHQGGFLAPNVPRILMVIMYVILFPLILYYFRHDIKNVLGRYFRWMLRGQRAFFLGILFIAVILKFLLNFLWSFYDFIRPYLILS